MVNQNGGLTDVAPAGPGQRTAYDNELCKCGGLHLRSVCSRGGSSETEIREQFLRQVFTSDAKMCENRGTPRRDELDCWSRGASAYTVFVMGRIGSESCDW